MPAAWKTALVLCLATAFAPGLADAGCALPAGSDAMQAELIAHLNAERVARGLPELVLNPELDRAAQKHACDNAKRLSISHVSSDGSKLVNRLRREGYRYRMAAENTGRGFASGKRAVEWWMDSPGHRKNMLMKGVEEIGVGIALSAEPDGLLHWVINIGKER